MLLFFIGGPVVCAGLVALLVSLRVVKKYEQGVPFRLGRVTGERRAGSTSAVPLVDASHRVSVRNRHSASLYHPTPEKRLFAASDVVGTRE